MGINIQLVDSEKGYVCKAEVWEFSGFIRNWLRREHHSLCRDVQPLVRVQPRWPQYFSFQSPWVRRSVLRKLEQTIKVHLHHSTPACSSVQSPATQELYNPSPWVSLAKSELLISAWIANIQSEVGRAHSEWEKNKDSWQDHEWISHPLLLKHPANNNAFDRYFG